MGVQGCLERRLYLPQDWCEDKARCDAARIPQAAQRFKTNPELALELLKQAWDEGIEMNWVTGDTLYGNSPSFRQGITESGRHYVLAVTQHHKLQHQGSGVKRINALFQTLVANDWSVTTKRASEHGFLEERWAFLRVSFDKQEQWLIFQSEHDVEAYLSNAPETSATDTLIRVILARHGIERSLQEATSDLGLADYEVRYFQAWLRHITLCLLAHTLLALCRHQQHQKRNGPCSLPSASLSVGPFSTSFSLWRYPRSATSATALVGVVLLALERLLLATGLALPTLANHFP